MLPMHSDRFRSSHPPALAALLAAWLAGALGAASLLGMAPPDAPSPLAPPAPVDARAMGIGRYVADSSGDDLAGKKTSWRSGRGERLTVIALTSVTCPLCKKFAPSLARIESAFLDRGVKFVYVNVSGLDSTEAMRKQVADLGFKGLYLNDRDGAIAAALGARTTTEVFVVDAGNTLVYRGPVSDQYGVDFTLDAPRQRLLESALEASIAGKAPGIAALASPGCAIEPKQASSTSAVAGSPAVTYARDISRIMQNNCVECHRAGGPGPFALDSFEAVSKRASMIRAVTQEGTMPPWFAAPMHGADGATKPSPWSNDRSLTDAEKRAIVAWIESGKPEGDRAELPAPRTFADGVWRIGTPDAIVQLPKPIAIKADGFMAYQTVVVPTNLAEDRWVKAVQIVPTDPSVVHHVLVFALDEADAQNPRVRRRLAAEEAGGYWAAYVPGNDHVIHGPGFARRLPARSSLLFQIHYTPNGTATSDQMKLGMVFANEPPRHVVRTASIADRSIMIPPGAPNHRESAQVRIPADARILAFMPHMHVRGKAYRYELEPADGGGRRTLLNIPAYDFNWQLRYELREPLAVEPGATLHGTAWYDNSAGNPANPDPTKTVRWGPQTVDEMMLGYIEYYLVNEDPLHLEELEPGSTPSRGLGQGARGITFDRLLLRFDANKDGTISEDEVPENLLPQFRRLDRTSNGVLERDDFAP
ncbi:MAG: redoxin family protein [Bacteroidia bacterium]|nr:redoxin family protein [Bacteroidia bacterium]